MTTSITYYESQLEKELALMEKHKKNAADLRKEIDKLKGEMTVSAVNALNLNGAEYSRFMKLLKQDKKSVMEAVDLVIEGENSKNRREGGGNEEKTE